MQVKLGLVEEDDAVRGLPQYEVERDIEDFAFAARLHPVERSIGIGPIELPCSHEVRADRPVADAAVREHRNQRHTSEY